MTTHDRQAMRIAQRIREHLVDIRQRERTDWPQRLRETSRVLERYQTLQRRMDLCVRHGFHGAARRLLGQLPAVLRDVRYEFDVVSTSVARLQANDIPVPHVRDLAGELEQLNDEFGSWWYDRHERAVCVTTESIELEDVYLGPFEIRLFVDELDSGGDSGGVSGGYSGGRVPCAVIAQDPHPAAGNEHVTHPHVSDERPCMGDATQTAGEALRSGRICDLFLLIRGILQTYNPDSPYVSLDQWYGDPCSDCGYRMDEDQGYRCEDCEQVVCDECVGTCGGCDRSMCAQCLHRCPSCEDPICDGCVQSCEACGEACCVSCLEDGLCSTCLEQKELDDETANIEVGHARS